MQTIDYHGWQECVRLANNTVEMVASTHFGPRIMRFAFLNGENVLDELPEWRGKIGPADKWVNYGGHRIWHAPEVVPRTYGPDNSPVKQVVMDGNALLLMQEPEHETRIGKVLRIQLGWRDMPLVKVDHILTNHNAWQVELAPWALSVVAPGGRVILPQEPYKGHGEDNDYAPVRPLALWSFTDMSDPRWSWGKEFIQLRSDASNDSPQKIGIYNGLGWGAYCSSRGDLLLKFIDVAGFKPDDYTDLGSNFETFTKGAFQEIETLGPMQLLDPGEQAALTEYWVLMRRPDLPQDDAGLAAVMPAILDEARRIVTRAEAMNKD